MTEMTYTASSGTLLYHTIPYHRIEAKIQTADGWPCQDCDQCLSILPAGLL